MLSQTSDVQPPHRIPVFGGESQIFIALPKARKPAKKFRGIVFHRVGAPMEKSRLPAHIRWQYLGKETRSMPILSGLVGWGDVLRERGFHR